MARKKDPKSKENIVNTAFILFLEKGYREVTIKNIMDATDLSKGAIYHHFMSKEEIYKATLHKYYFKILNNDTKEIITGDFKKDVKTLYHFATEIFTNIENLSEDKIEYPIRSFFNFQLESEINKKIRDQITQTVKDYRTSVQQMIQHAIDTNQIQSELDVEAHAFQIIGIIEGIALNHSTIKKNVKSILLRRYKQVFDDYLKMILISDKTVLS